MADRLQILRREKEVKEPEDRGRVEQHINVLMAFILKVFLFVQLCSVEQKCSLCSVYLHMQSKRFLLFMADLSWIPEAISLCRLLSEHFVSTQLELIFTQKTVKSSSSVWSNAEARGKAACICEFPWCGTANYTSTIIYPCTRISEQMSSRGQVERTSQTKRRDQQRKLSKYKKKRIIWDRN